mmetsp:Transcript_11610/g.32864  ORF Transcript_11610/g.32864 Transcript_11610/m.32864 type:complete len:316 (+) Transcript_11610:298-1245(+)
MGPRAATAAVNGFLDVAETPAEVKVLLLDRFEPIFHAVKCFRVKQLLHLHVPLLDRGESVLHVAECFRADPPLRGVGGAAAGLALLLHTGISLPAHGWMLLGRAEPALQQLHACPMAAQRGQGLLDVLYGAMRVFVLRGDEAAEASLLLRDAGNRGLRIQEGLVVLRLRAAGRGCVSVRPRPQPVRQRVEPPPELLHGAVVVPLPLLGRAGAPQELLLQHGDCRLVGLPCLLDSLARGRGHVAEGGLGLQECVHEGAAVAVDIQTGADPRSLVIVRVVPFTCIRLHLEAPRMAPAPLNGHGMPIVTHGRAILEMI